MHFLQYPGDIYLVLIYISITMPYFMLATELGSTILMYVIKGLNSKLMQKLLTCPYCLSFHIYFWPSMLASGISNTITNLAIAMLVATASRYIVKYGL